MFWNVKTWQLHSGHWRYWETRAKVQELTFWGHFKMKWILISNSKQYIWPFLFEWMPRMSSVSPECRGAGTWGNVLHICQLSGGDQRQVTACNTSYHPASTSSPQPVNQDTINGPSYNSGHAEARYFIVSCSGRKCDEDRDTSSVWRGVNTGL